MPIDPAQALGAELPGDTYTWDENEIILYQLALGAGRDPLSPTELSYTYEGQLKVLPTYGVIPVHRMLAHVPEIKGLDFNPIMLLHGEQDLEILQPIPTSATVRNSGRVAGIYDKRKAALVILETTSFDAADRPLFVNRFSMFMRGEGGFGGDSGPKTTNERPDREPDLVVESPTLPQQALLYRLCGDSNPLHADPAFAQMAGFERPILHGLCSYGIVCKAVIDALLEGDTARVARYQVRFRGVVYPGETIVTSMWREGDRVLLEAATKERQSPVLSNAVIQLRS